MTFSDTQDFDEHERGLIAEMPQKQILADAGHVAWDKERFDFLDTDRLRQHPSVASADCPPEPEVWGIRGQTGWIVIDPLISAKPARAAVEFFQEDVGEGRPVTALHEAGDYLLASEILNKLVHAEPRNQPVRDLLADVYEQIGHQQENPGLRNSFLSDAFELRSGVPEGDSADTSSPDVIRAMSTELFLNFLAIKRDGRKVAGHPYKINLSTPDNGETFLIELSSSTLINVEGYLHDDPDLSMTIGRTDLETVMAGEKDLEAQFADGSATFEGDIGILGVLAAAMADFDPLFEGLPGTRDEPAIEAHSEAFQAVPGRSVID